MSMLHDNGPAHDVGIRRNGTLGAVEGHKGPLSAAPKTPSVQSARTESYELAVGTPQSRTSNFEIGIELGALIVAMSMP
jgi:hypothetical protein